VGTLTLGVSAVTAGQSISAASIAAGDLKFTPAPNANGAAHASFTFQVQDDGGTANGGVDLDPVARTMTVDVTAANDAPSLSGTNNLSGINRNPVSNPGTLVADLIAGHVTEVDVGALGGIAVTAVDNANGAWQFSTDGGSTWSAFGSPTVGAARLLAADIATFVRFVPNTNYSGTVTSGLTFKAWDRTSGSAGSTADATVGGGTTAFSAAGASASITVTACGDRRRRREQRRHPGVGADRGHDRRRGPGCGRRHRRHRRRQHQRQLAVLAQLGLDVDELRHAFRERGPTARR
jgi:hypothetical protein